MTKLEQAARALLADKHPDLPWEVASNVCRMSFIGHARAVIESLREPTEGILDAGADAIDDGETPGVRTAAELCWTAMIDAILKEAS